MDEQFFKCDCGFFDSIEKDRLYSADEMNRPYRRLVSNGVFATEKGDSSTDLQVFSADDGMNIIVKGGEGIFANKWFENIADIAITVPSNTAIVPRRDSVIVRIDKRPTGRNGGIVYVCGTPASNPIAPEINMNDNVIEYRIANIYVSASATKIGQENITDLRGTEECPWVTSLVKQVDTSTLFVQWQKAFENYYSSIQQDFVDYEEAMKESFTEWFDTVKDQLSEDAAGKLQNEFDKLMEEVKVNTNNISDLQNNIDNLEISIMGVDSYSNTSTYKVDDIVVYDRKIYKCITAITTAEEFDATKWSQIDLVNNGLIILEEEEIEI